METPGHLLVIRKEANSFEDAIQKLMNASEIGVSVLHNQFGGLHLRPDGVGSLRLPAGTGGGADQP